jgi:nitrous oxidase accessory protein NosD
MMRAPSLLLLLGTATALPLVAQELPRIRPTAGLVITASARIAPGTYRLAAPANPDAAAITIRGEGIVLDLTGVTLLGTAAEVDPDQRTGLAILIDGGRNVTIKGGRIRGYQTGIRAVGTTDLSLLDIDLSHNWKPRLFSRITHESLVDWLSYHKNENNEWRRFGAGIALEGVHRGLVRGVTVRQGMNGLMLTRTDSVRIEQSDLSFNSGLGIGLYRSSDNVIVRNRVDYNVRGYSHGFFRRGQDSADLLMFEQSSRNLVAWNSMTHGGDGLFLWAGQHTMDTGEGGSNDNLFLGNDFSYAPTNGMEATFSRNAFVGNRIMGSDHGLWGGYSFGSQIIGNCFAGNRVGIAIEHGQENVVAGNSFQRDSTAVFLWAEPIEPSDWGYPKHRDTRSRDWRFEGNSFRDHRVGLRIRQTAGLVESEDTFLNVDSVAVMRDTSGFRLDHQIHDAGIQIEPCQTPMSISPEWLARAPAADSQVVPATDHALRPRSDILIDEWGPYDFSTPRLWPIDSLQSGAIRLRVLGPPGPWYLKTLRGVREISAGTGRFGDTLTITPLPGATRDWEVVLEDERHRRFRFEEFAPATPWLVRYFAWSDSTAWNGPPILAHNVPRLDRVWYQSPYRELPQSNWSFEATTTVDLPRGEYTLRTISDDAIQVWVNDTLVIDNWTPHGSTVDHAPLGRGRHEIRVRYRQVDGWVEYRVEILKGRVRSQGSPGPH